MRNLFGRRGRRRRAGVSEAPEEEGETRRRSPLTRAAHRDASAANLSQDPSYLILLERLTTLEQDFDIRHYSLLFEGDSADAVRQGYDASPREIQRQLDLLIGPPSVWCTRSAEVIDFRAKMAAIRKRNQPCFRRRRRGLRRVEVEPTMEMLPVYLSSEPPPENSHSLVFLVGVHIPASSEFAQPILQSVPCTANKVASVFLSEIIAKANRVRARGTSELRARSFVLKLTGSNEFVYGDRALYEFQAIRRCLKYGQVLASGKPAVELNLVKKSEEFAKIDTRMLALKDYSYMVDFEEEGIENEDIRIGSVPLDSAEVISIRDLGEPFRFNLVEFSLTGDIAAFCAGKHGRLTEPKREKTDIDSFLLQHDTHLLYTHAKIVQGGHVLGEAFSKLIPFGRRASFDQVLKFPKAEGEMPQIGKKPARANPDAKFIAVSDLPRETVILVTVWSRKSASESASDALPDVVEPQDGDETVGAYSFPLLDFRGTLRTGLQTWRLNIGQEANLWSFGEGSRVIELVVKFEEYCLPVVFPRTTAAFTPAVRKKFSDWEALMSYKYSIIKGQMLNAEVHRLVKMTPIDELDERQKWILWKSREHLVSYPNLLPKFLQSVPWHIPKAIDVAHQLLIRWKKNADPLAALELLDHKFADREVRRYAVLALMDLSDREIQPFTLQLVQALKFELHHDSPLARFLLQRALGNPEISQAFYWHMKSELHIKAIRERFGLMLEEFLKRCGGFRVELMKQVCVTEQLYKVALAMKRVPARGNRAMYNEALHRALAKVILPPEFKLPLTHRVICRGLEIEDCRVMTSAQLPLLLHFRNSDPFMARHYEILFKAGDDLRQDMLTLQMFRIMDDAWKAEGIDNHIRAYDCVCTGYVQGMVEIVQQSDTICNIAYDKGINSALSKKALLDWLKKKNHRSDYDEMTQNFAKSAAGYCVATYALGIGDRHPSNIMCCEQGDLFHIDFGHFLGHFKTFAGVKRESAPFVFSNLYAHVLGGPRNRKFKMFEDWCCRSFLILRKKTNLLITLFLLMLGCGIPELETLNDIRWVQNAMVLDKSDEEGAEFFQFLIKVAMRDKRTVLNQVCRVVCHSMTVVPAVAYHVA